MCCGRESVPAQPGTAQLQLEQGIACSIPCCNHLNHSHWLPTVGAGTSYLGEGNGWNMWNRTATRTGTGSLKQDIRMRLESQKGLTGEPMPVLRGADSAGKYV